MAAHGLADRRGASPRDADDPALDRRWLEEIARDHPDRGASQRRAVLWPRRLLGDMLPADLDDAAVQDYVERRHASRPGGMARDTLRSEIAAVRAALRWAHKAKRIPDPPEFKLPDGSPARDVWLDETTEARVHAAALAELYDPPGRNSRDRDCARQTALFFLIALNTAARREAIMQLTWDRVDLDRDMVNFHVPGRRITRKRRVTLHIAKRLRPALEYAKSLATDPRVFPGTTQHGIRTFRERHGVPQLTPHVCRHTWATLAARRGFSLFKIGLVLGDNIETVERRYLHHTPEHGKDVLDSNGTQPVAIAA
jgi:integrase